jgi:hypothetical protein
VLFTERPVVRRHPLTRWEWLCDVVLTRPTGPALYDISVRNLAGLATASFPPTVARTQLPSPSALSIGVVIWYIELVETPSLAQGTNPEGWHPINSRPCWACLNESRRT